jgi:uncharacterized protein (TIGR02757 family)
MNTASLLLQLAKQDSMQWEQNDPIRFVKHYTKKEDQEIAAIIASGLAFGKARLFCPVIEQILIRCDREGGPAAFTKAFQGQPVFVGLQYRWHQEPDFSDLFWTLKQVLARYGSLGEIFPASGSTATCLDKAVSSLKACMPKNHRVYLERFFPSPKDRSACKRLVMMLRWLVRREAPDIGIWTHLSPKDLMLPLDVHTGRISRFLGLTARTDASWKTVEEITQALRKLDPEDPIRFDFALAHLGISEGCKGYKVPEICDRCPIQSVCTAGLKAPIRKRAAEAVGTRVVVA